MKAGLTVMCLLGLAAAMGSGGCVPGRGALAKIARERLVARLDVNKDGVVDAAELEPLRERIEELKARVHKELLARFDKDGDGALSAEERAAAWKAASRRLAEAHEAAVAGHDTDGNGELDDAELKAAFADARARRGLPQAAPEVRAAVERIREEALARYDLDRSGGLNAGERAAVRSALLDAAKPAFEKARERLERGERLVSDEQILAWLNEGR